MTAPPGTCKLCLSEGVELRDSHIVPRWVYKRILRDQGDIVQLKGRDIVPSRDQLKEYLLCFDCEQLCGTTEREVCELTASSRRGTRLEQLIGPIVARHELCDIRSIPPHVSASLSRFCAIMVWRASVSGEADQCHLGPKYEETLRRYVANPESVWPAAATCFVWLHQGNIMNGAAGPPVTQRSDMCHFHRFPLCGLEFVLFVGGSLPSPVQRLHLLQANNIAMAGPGLLDEWLSVPLMNATARGRLAQRTETQPIVSPYHPSNEQCTASSGE